MPTTTTTKTAAPTNYIAYNDITETKRGKMPNENKSETNRSKQRRKKDKIIQQKFDKYKLIILVGQ